MTVVPPVAVLVATKDRPGPLAILLASLATQTVRPVVTVVVDASGPAASQQVELAIEDAKATGLLVVLLRPGRAGMTTQRNFGVDYLRDHCADVKLVQVFDDDVLPTPRHLERAAKVFVSPGHADVGAVSGVTPRGEGMPARPMMDAFQRLFLLRPGPPGTVSIAGRNAGVEGGTEESCAVETEWVFGCSMFRAEVFDEQRYWEPPGGYVLYEDVDFSIRMRGRWRLMVLPNLVMEHAVLSRVNPDYRRIGFQEVAHRHRVVSRLGRRGGLLAFWWSTVGWLGLLTVKAIRRPGGERGRLRGALAGALAALRDVQYR